MMVESEDSSSSQTLSGPPQEHMCEIDLRGSHATVLKINRFGTAVAIGTHSGDIVIVDYTTKIIVKELKGHPLPVSSIDWSNDGKLIASASEDGTTNVFNVDSTEILCSYNFNSCNNQIHFHPRDNNIVTILKPKDSSITSLKLDKKEEVKYEYRHKPQLSEDNITTIAYSQRGKFLIAGTNKSNLILFDAKTFKYVKHMKQANNHQVRQIYVSKKKDLIVTNSSDRYIRVFKLNSIVNAKAGEMVPYDSRYSDAVSKRNYMFVGMSPDARYVCATENSSHEITIWDLWTQTVATPLRGTIGNIPSDLQWHTTRQEILTVAGGKVHVFGRRIVTTMSAFAPNFKEINDNFIHVEEEGEFDMYDEDADEPIKIAEDDVEVDIEALPLSDMPWKSDDEEDFDLNEAEKHGNAPLIMVPASLDNIISYDPDEDSDPEYDRLEPEPPVKRKRDDEIFRKPRLPDFNNINRVRSESSGTSSADTRLPKIKRARNQ
jgi:COMPASS component SWD1